MSLNYLIPVSFHDAAIHPIEKELFSPQGGEVLIHLKVITVLTFGSFSFSYFNAKDGFNGACGYLRF